LLLSDEYFARLVPAVHLLFPAAGKVSKRAAAAPGAIESSAEAGLEVAAPANAE